ncbi:phosphoethanolamine transferase [uncultured Duncaniella sp.]|uniref:phosphoethanolamine transferase n=1 Tax=uncultured Duncaniella sp. TaxID=2768039 RepID=UPI0025A98D0C|nr:phosphoethanolamine transferase [uncultured Duncaniella sp.]
MFKNIVFYIFLLSLLLPNIVLSFTEQLTPLGALTNIVLPGGIMYLLLSISPKIGRSIWMMFPLVFFAAFQIVLLALYGRSIIAVDMFLNLVTTNSSEVTELLGSLAPVISFVVLLYVPSLIAAGIFIHKGTLLDAPFVKSNFRVASGICIIGIGLLVCSFTSPTPYSTTSNLYPVNVGYNIYLAIDRTRRTGNYHQTSASFRYDAVPSHTAGDRELYMLVIGETSRAENWQLLGYTRTTNPKLTGRHDIITSTRAYSESNTTHKSVPMLLSPVDATNFDTDIYKVKSIVTAFKDAGFSTAFLSNQRYNHSFIDFFAFESDTTVFIKELDRISNPLEANRKPDSELLPVIDNIMAQGNKKQLIVVHTYGSHFNYIDRYSDADKRFTPCDYKEAVKEERDKLINAYDNTIVATDRFLSECIDRLESLDDVKSGLLYTSDHGEDIFDDEHGRFLHASPRPSIHQVHVPFIAWLSEKYRAAYPENSLRLRKNARKLLSTSRSFTPTALDIAGIKVSGDALSDTTASLVSSDYLPRKPLYLSDHNIAVRLKDIL